MTLRRATDAHVYRTSRPDTIPPDHSAQVFSTRLPFIVVYGNDWDGWHQHTPGYNISTYALADARYLAGRHGQVYDHTGPGAG